MFRKVRIMILLYVLLLVAGGAWLARERTTDWDQPLWVAVHPIAGDSAPATQAFAARLSNESFADIDAFFNEQGKRYGLGVTRPFVVRRAAVLDEIPPVPPGNGNPLAVMWWSLKLRWWSWGVEREHDDIPAEIRVYFILHDPALSPHVPDSLGLQKGLIGVTHGFASREYRRRNNVIIAHELLHTVGAKDKYDLSTNLPLYPEGYAEPDQQPLYPQQLAEIMGGRVPLSRSRAETPRSLKRVVVGSQTALEIRWQQ